MPTRRWRVNWYPAKRSTGLLFLTAPSRESSTPPVALALGAGRLGQRVEQQACDLGVGALEQRLHRRALALDVELDRAVGEALVDEHLHLEADPQDLGPHRRRPGVRAGGPSRRPARPRTACGNPRSPSRRRATRPGFAISNDFQRKVGSLRGELRPRPRPCRLRAAAPGRCRRRAASCRHRKRPPRTPARRCRCGSRIGPRMRSSLRSSSGAAPPRRATDVPRDYAVGSEEVETPPPRAAVIPCEPPPLASASDGVLDEREAPAARPPARDPGRVGQVVPGVGIGTRREQGHPRHLQRNGRAVPPAPQHGHAAAVNAQGGQRDPCSSVSSFGGFMSGGSSSR